MKDKTWYHSIMVLSPYDINTKVTSLMKYQFHLTSPYQDCGTKINKNSVLSASLLI